MLRGRDAGEDEDAGADDGADAEQHQVARPRVRFRTVLVAGIRFRAQAAIDFVAQRLMPHASLGVVTTARLAT